MLVLSCFCPGRANLHDGMQSMCLMSVQACTDSKHAFVWHMSGPDAVPVHAHRLWLGGSNKHIKKKSLNDHDLSLSSLCFTLPYVCVVFFSLSLLCLSLFSIFSSFIFSPCLYPVSLSPFPVSLPPPTTLARKPLRDFIDFIDWQETRGLQSREKRNGRLWDSDVSRIWKVWRVTSRRGASQTWWLSSGRSPLLCASRFILFNLFFLQN